MQERLFRRFVTTRADKGGTGLGLAIVRAVAEAHGGRAELVKAGPPESCSGWSCRWPGASIRRPAADAAEGVLPQKQPLAAARQRSDPRKVPATPQ